MQRLFAVVLAVFALAAPASAGQFSDSDRSFTLTSPDGWMTEAGPGQPIRLVITSPRKAQTGGNCNVAVTPPPAGKTQAELNEAGEREVNNEAFWKAMFGALKIFKTTTIEKFGAREQGGRKIFFVKAVSVVESGNLTLALTQLMDMHPTPDHLYAVTCTALTPAYAAEEADIAAIMGSFQPSPGLTVSAMRMPLSFGQVRAIAHRTAADSSAFGALRLMRRR